MAAGRNILGGIGEAFADRNFRIYSVGSIASWLSFFVQIVAVSWLTWELTGSTTWLAVMALLDIVPNVLLLPLGGALADRFDRYRIMFIVDFLLLLQAVVMALLAWTGMLTIWPLAVLVLIHGCLISFMVPAMFGMLPRFVAKARLVSAIAVNSSYTQLAIFAGPAIAGWIITFHSLTAAFAVNALGYAVHLASLVFLRTPADYRQPKSANKTILGDIVEGVRYIRDNRAIAALLMLLLVGDALSAATFHMAPAYSETILGRGVDGLSTLLASIGFGALAAALWLARRGEKSASIDLVLRAMLVMLLAIGALYLVDTIYLAAAVGVVIGMAAETRRTASFAFIQLAVTEEQRGRLMGNMFLLKQLAGGIGTWVIGSFAASQGLVAPMLIAVGVALLVWSYFFLNQDRLRAGPAPAAEK